MPMDWPVSKEVLIEVVRFFQKNKERIRCIRYGIASDEQSGEEIPTFAIISAKREFDWDLSDDIGDLQTVLAELGKYDTITIPSSCEEDIGAIIKMQPDWPTMYVPYQ